MLGVCFLLVLQFLPCIAALGLGRVDLRSTLTVLLQEKNCMGNDYFYLTPPCMSLTPSLSITIIAIAQLGGRQLELQSRKDELKLFFFSLPCSGS